MVLANLDKYYNSETMFKAHMNLILSPIQECHKEYFETLMKYRIREFDKSRESGKRIVEWLISFKRRGNVIKKDFTFKADLNETVASQINKDKLFGTLPEVHDNLADRTYKLSEKTLARVDSDINNIVANGYNEGWGINAVAKDITERFDQLETWEAKRIARTEIQQSHNQGLLQGYIDLDVEYLQWSTSIDGRERDSHRDLDGEIIPMGGVFSNGLMYPGDMLGSAEEVINCRCQALPYIIPDGYIAPPDMMQFRESDLIQTLDFWNQDELINQAISDMTSEAINPSYAEKPIKIDDVQIINPDTPNSIIGLSRSQAKSLEYTGEISDEYLLELEALEHKEKSKLKKYLKKLFKR